MIKKKSYLLNLLEKICKKVLFSLVYRVKSSRKSQEDIRIWQM